MLVFVDESGDAGMKLDAGSSDFFIVTAVLFEDEANECDDGLAPAARNRGCHTSPSLAKERTKNRLACPCHWTARNCGLTFPAPWRQSELLCRISTESKGTKQEKRAATGLEPADLYGRRGDAPACLSIPPPRTLLHRCRMNFGSGWSVVKAGVQNKLPLQGTAMAEPEPSQARVGPRQPAEWE